MICTPQQRTIRLYIGQVLLLLIHPFISFPHWWGTLVHGVVFVKATYVAVTVPPRHHGHLYDASNRDERNRRDCDKPCYREKEYNGRYRDDRAA